MQKKIILGFILLAFMTGCQKESQEWNPIFENTSFDYLYTEIERSISIIDEASSETLKGNEGAINEKLNQAKNSLLEIKGYYLPLTTVRHKIYDAERFLKLKEIKKTENLLTDSKSILKSIDSAAKNQVFDKVILELESMIDKTILSLDDKSKSTTYNNMKTLGEHINLMLSKGDLVLSGVEFSR
jgi:hypothetical protein